MKLTRLSLIYLATYLTTGGLGFFFFPTGFSRLLLSNVTYEETPIRLAGIFSTLLGIVVIQMVRHRVEVLYPTSVLARVLGLIALLSLYIVSRNPMFLSLFVIVIIGMTATIVGLMKDKQKFSL
jgi:uncharacterized protein YjeT (DUF2065 family)